MKIELIDILIALSYYFIGGIIFNGIGMYLQYYVGNSIKKLQIKYITKHAPEVKDNRIKKEVEKW